MKKIFLLLCLILSLATFSQSPPSATYTPIQGGFYWNRGEFKAIGIPFGATPTLQTNQWNGNGQLWFRTTDSSIYALMGGTWVKQRGSGGGGGGGAETLGTLLDIDTSGVQQGWGIYWDTTTHSWLVKDFVIDTTNKWVQNNYVRNDSLFKFKNGVETFLGVFGATDTTSLSDRINLKADKAITLTAGYGLSGGGDLSNNRSFAVDTALIATKWKIDSLGVDKVSTTRAINTTFPIQGGGNFSSDRTIYDALSAEGNGITTSGDQTSALNTLFASSTINVLEFNTNGDFTISGTVNAKGKTIVFKNGARLIGSGTLDSALIECNYQQQCFATSLSFTHIMNSEVSVMWYGMKGDNSTDNRSIFQNLINSFSVGATNSIQFPYAFSSWNFSDSIVINDRPLQIYGQSGSGEAISTILKFATDKRGILITRSVGYQRAYIHDLVIQGQKSNSTYDVTKPGLEFNSVLWADRFNVNGFKGDGIVAYGNVGLGTDVSLSHLNNFISQSNNGNGWVNYFGDANALNLESPDVRDNGKWGGYDSSFLGVTINAPHGNNNTLGNYRLGVGGANAHTVVTGIYNESGSPIPYIRGNTVLIGGIAPDGMDLGAASVWIDGSHVHGNLNFEKVEASTRISYIGLGSAQQSYTVDGGATLTLKPKLDSLQANHYVLTPNGSNYIYKDQLKTPGLLVPTEAVSSPTRTMASFGDNFNFLYTGTKRIQVLYCSLSNLLSLTNSYPYITGDQFHKGDILFNAFNYDSSKVEGYVCTRDGTLGTLSEADTVSSQSGAIITLRHNTTALRIGDGIYVNGNYTRIESYEDNDYSKLHVSPAVIANNGDIITYAAPLFKAFGSSKGTTANRPTLNLQDAGIWYYNVTVDSMQYWSGSAWNNLPSGGGMTVPGSSTELQYRINSTTLGASPVATHQTPASDQIRFDANGISPVVLFEGHEDIGVNAITLWKTTNGGDTVASVNKDSTLLLPNRNTDPTQIGTTGKYGFKNNLPYAWINGNAYDLTSGGYTNLTSFVDQTAWRVFYSNGSGDVTELALGNSGEFLKSNGASSAPSWATPAGSGDMVLADVQSVTGLKTFDKDKLAMKGTSTGVTTISTANTGVTNYTATLQAADGTIAYLSDISTAYLSNSTTSTQDGYFGTIKLKDITNPSHYLTIRDNEDLTAAHTLNLITGDADRTLTFTGDASISGTNTGDQTTVSGNAGTATTLQTPRNIWGQSFNGSADITGSLTSVTDITGGASSMIITAGTGNSRTMTLRSTTSGGTATAFLTGNADQSSTFGGNISGTGAWTLTGGAGNMTITAGTGNSRTLALQSTTSGGTATTFLTGNADQSATFANVVTAGNFTANATTVPVEGMYRPTGAGNLGFSVSSAAELLLTATAFSPAANDGNALGTSSLGWGDLFLASGAVIDIGAGDYTLTHSTGILTANKDLRVTTAGTNSASVVTVGGTQTLTSKTLTSPVIGTGLTASGSASNDFSGSTGTFKTSTGTNTLGGATDVNAAFREKVVTVSDGAGAVIDASLGNIFDWSAAADRTAGTTTNPTNGQKIIIRFTASGGARTLTLPTATTGDFAFGSDITAITQTASGKTDLIGCVYSTTLNRWMVAAYTKGF